MLIDMDYGTSSGGSLPIETTLWENSSPTSSMTTQTITLSDDITNYDYLKVEYRQTTSTDTRSILVFTVNDFITNGIYTAVGPKFTLGIRGSSVNHARPICYSTNTAIYIMNCYAIGATNSASGSCIPLKIVGIKLNYPKVDFTPIIISAQNYTKTTVTQSINPDNKYLIINSVNYSTSYTPNAQCIFYYKDEQIRVLQRSSSLESVITCSYSNSTISVTSTGNASISLTVIQIE